MAEELQGLLERIQSQGLKKAEEERDKILSEAKQQASEIVAKAESEAESLRTKAREDAESAEKRAHATIKQAARDIVLSLKEDLLSRLRRLVAENVGEAMTPEVMGGIIKEMVAGFASRKGGDNPGLELLVARKDVEAMEKLLRGSLAKDIRDNPELISGQGFSSGLKIGFKGEDLFIDVSDDAIGAMICKYVGPKLASIIESGDSSG